MGRKYELKKRAERQEETRRRIVEAAVELHGTIGPARTTVSAVAERAGVQRHTYYRHFPDERSLGLACSGLYMETNPMPDPEPWREIDDLEQRLRHGLGELYAYYERNEPMLSNAIRDAELDPVFAEIGRMRMGPPLSAIRAVLASGRRSKRLLGVLDVALAFSTWRTLVRDSGLSQKEAVETMAAAIRCVRSA
jgi:AcrR family transcriptional regulator